MILIFRHIPCEGPGHLLPVLQREDLTHRIIRIDAGEPVPGSLAGISGLVFMGGPMSVNDPLPWIGQELALIRAAAAASLPVLGHCLGAQLISRALGGKITGNPVPEIGWLPVEICADAADNPWLDDIPSRFEAFHWHGETFSIPAGAIPVFQSAHCPRQGFVRDNILALQFHVEVTSAMVQEWARLYAHDIATPTQTVQSAEDMQINLTARVRSLNEVADKLYGAWLANVVSRHQTGP